MREAPSAWPCTVITVPVSMLWKVQISLRQKLALAGIFSITVFVMIFAIIRVVVISSQSDQPDQTWLYTWSAIEQAVGKSTRHRKPSPPRTYSCKTFSRHMTSGNDGLLLMHNHCSHYCCLSRLLQSPFHPKGTSPETPRCWGWLFEHRQNLFETPASVQQERKEHWNEKHGECTDRIPRESKRKQKVQPFTRRWFDW